MRLALREAWKGLGTTAPNPMVGAVIVKNGNILARGFHSVAGGPHAELVALNSLTSREDAREATLYVTLEPCSTHGRTAPCTEAILQAGFARVVYGATDPNPKHQGTAKTILEQAGISVTRDILVEKCVALNHAWHHRMKTGMPWIIAKCGMSLDGRIGVPSRLTDSSPTRCRITSEASHHHAILFRRRVDAILVGGGTVRSDNPRLTLRGIRYSVRKEEPHQPWRVILTDSGNIPVGCHLLTDEYRHKTILLQRLSLRKGLQNLAARGISSLLIEGGGITLGSFFEQQLIDEVRFYIAPIMLGGTILALRTQDPLPLPFVTLKKRVYRTLGEDLFISGLIAK